MLDIVYNPNAGCGLARSYRPTVEKRLRSSGVDFAIHETSCEKDGIRIARELSENGSDKIIAMGGDGTVNEVLNGIIDLSSVIFGIIPCGSGNDFAASAGIPTEVHQAVDILITKEPKYTDYMECSGVRGINAIGTGIDVDILMRCMKKGFLKGKSKYFASLLISLFKFENYNLKLFREGRITSHNAMILCVANGRQFGGGIKIAPEAIIDDGFMDLVLVDNISGRRIPGALIKLMQGKITHQDFTLFERVSEASAEFEKPISVQIDGEIYQDMRFDVKLTHNELKMYR